MKIKKTIRLHSFLKGLGRYRRFQPRQEIESRYAMRIINNSFYCVID